MSKFNDLYKKIISESSNYPSGFNPNDAGGLRGKIAYNTNEFSDNNPEMIYLRNGQPVILPNSSGDPEPVKWEFMMSNKGGRDIVTGEKFPKYSQVFFAKAHPDAYLLLSTYENAYGMQNPDLIEKIEAVGFKPGFKIDSWSGPTY